MKISESIWSNENVIIPMAEVSHIENDARPEYKGSVSVIFKHSRWVNDNNGFEPSVYLQRNSAEKFIKDWCYYRSEVEDIEPAMI